MLAHAPSTNGRADTTLGGYTINISTSTNNPIPLAELLLKVITVVLKVALAFGAIISRAMET